MNNEVVEKKKWSISVLSFAKDKMEYFFQPNQRYIKWPEQPLYLKVYDEVTEHTSAINFILNNLVIDGIDDIDYWNLQKLALDYLIYGGFTQEIQKLRNGSYKLNYIDMGRCRLGPEKDKMGYADSWENYKVDIKWKPIVENVSKDGIYYFKNNKSRGDYPKPYYYSVLKSLDTMACISEYHNNNAKGGFTPNVLINFNNGEPDDETKKEIERKITDKFTGASGQKFILSFNESEQTKTTIEKLENDNLDQRFESLQKFIQNQIIVAHQITSGQLIGVKPEDQGFSGIEYEESYLVFLDVVVSTFRKELEYALSKMLNKEVLLKQKEIIKTVKDGNGNIINDEPINETTTETTTEMVEENNK